jgi:ubiquinone/menaquinone biosynthesis C-methylase UbiE
VNKHNTLIKWTPKTYSKISPLYDFFAPVFLSIGEKAKRRVVDNLSSKGSILDIACGTGALLKLAHEKGLECHGIDNAEGMIAVSRKKIPEGSFNLASFYAIPYPNDSFDYVVETNAVSGVAIQADQVMREMLRVCKPGGKVLIGDYCKAPTRSHLTEIIERVGRRIGDHPHDFAGMFKQFGFEPQVEFLGWGGMYQFIQVEVR